MVPNRNDLLHDQKDPGVLPECMQVTLVWCTAGGTRLSQVRPLPRYLWVSQRSHFIVLVLFGK